jgi:hypothetical protein
MPRLFPGLITLLSLHASLTELRSASILLPLARLCSVAVWWPTAGIWQQIRKSEFVLVSIKGAFTHAQAIPWTDHSPFLSCGAQIGSTGTARAGWFSGILGCAVIPVPWPGP